MTTIKRATKSAVNVTKFNDVDQIAQTMLDNVSLKKKKSISQSKSKSKKYMKTQNSYSNINNNNNNNSANITPTNDNINGINIDIGQSKSKSNNNYDFSTDVDKIDFNTISNIEFNLSTNMNEIDIDNIDYNNIDVTDIKLDDINIDNIDIDTNVTSIFDDPNLLSGLNINDTITTTIPETSTIDDDIKNTHSETKTTEYNNNNNNEVKSENKSNEINNSNNDNNESKTNPKKSPKKSGKKGHKKSNKKPKTGVDSKPKKPKTVSRSDYLKKKFETKSKQIFKYKLKDLRERSFLLIADETKRINAKMLFDYLEHVSNTINANDGIKFTVKMDDVTNFTTYMQADPDGYVSFSKFVRFIDEDGQVFEAFIRYIKTGNSRIDIKHDKNSDIKLKNQQQNELKNKKMVKNFGGLKSTKSTKHIQPLTKDKNVLNNERVVTKFSGLKSTTKQIQTAVVDENEFQGKVKNNAYMKLIQNNNQ